MLFILTSSHAILNSNLPVGFWYFNELGRQMLTVGCSGGSPVVSPVTNYGQNFGSLYFLFLNDELGLVVW